MFDTFIAELREGHSLDRETHALMRELLLLMGSIVDQQQHILQLAMNEDDEAPTHYMDGSRIS